MARAIPRSACAIFALAAWGAFAEDARAHFPVVRAAAFERDGGTAAAIALPGFGLVMRPSADEPFAYLCNALIDAPQSDAPPALTFVGDGSLLVGTSSGLRRVSREGCPEDADAGVLSNLSLSALSAHAKIANLVYAVTGELMPRVLASEDGGRTWEFRATLPADGLATALVLSELEPNLVYVSQSAAAGGSNLHVSHDGGASFSTFQERDGLSLLDVESGGASDAGTGRLWGRGRDRNDPRAVALFSATSPEGPWTSSLTVNYFGGFARDPSGTMFVGDEGGGLYRSGNDGSTFDAISPGTGLSCLEFAQGSLFGCTPGLTTDSALVKWNQEKGAFDPVVALANIREMVTCASQTAVATTCAVAWVEWKRDVVGVPSSARDAGGAPDGSTEHVAPVSVGASGGCGVATAVAQRSPSWLGVLLFAIRMRRRRRTR